MAKRGRPKVKKAEFKKPFPMRFSDAELKLFEEVAGKTPVRQWIRDTLYAAVGPERFAKLGLKLAIQEALTTGKPVTLTAPKGTPKPPEA